MKNQRGSLTVEASIVFPIFIIVVLTFAMLIKVFYVHSTVQFALNGVSNKLSTYGYYYKKSGILEAHNDVYGSMTESSESLRNKMQIAGNSMKNINSTVSGVGEAGDSLKQSFDNIVGSFSSITDGGNPFMIENIFTEGDRFISELTSFKKNTFESIGDVCSEAENITDVVKSIVSNKTEATEAVVKECVDLTNNLVGSTIAKMLLKSQLEDKGIERYIVGGFDGLDFRMSSYMLKDSEIDIIVKYKIKIPTPLEIVEDFSIINRVTSRAWTGRD